MGLRSSEIGKQWSDLNADGANVLLFWVLCGKAGYDLVFSRTTLNPMGLAVFNDEARLLTGENVEGGVLFLMS
jgi:hypothetical protein